jgi:hypothetical protein
MYHYLYVGVVSLRAVKALWQDLMGFEAFALPPSHAASLEQLWAMPPGSIASLLGLQTPSAPAGRLVFVEFSVSSPAVREGAAVTDLCPKNLDVNVVDLFERAAELEAAGYELRSSPVEYQIDQLEVREVQLGVHDDINLVLAEIVGEDLTTTSRGYGGVTSVVTTVDDLPREMALLEALEFPLLDAHRLVGPAIEQMIGLPRGGELHMQLLGNPVHRFGRAELVKYVGVRGANRYSLAVPPARGLLRGAIQVEDSAASRRALLTKGFDCGELFALPDVDGGESVVYSVRSPVGWILDVWGARSS